MKYFFLLLFYLAQSSGAVLIRYASLATEHKKVYWAIAILTTFTSMTLMTELFKRMTVPLVIGLCMGGGFAIMQFVLAAWFKNPLSLWQIVGTAVVCLGIGIIGKG
jgi:multidrug transporter EmrE-like cation transporter